MCPECSTKHPLSAIAERRSFPCEGCGRTLKVPAAAAAAATAAVPSGAVRAAAPSAPVPAAPEPAASLAPEPVGVEFEPEPVTRVMPVADPPPPMPATTPAPNEPRERRARDPIPPRWVRFLLWIVAIPLGFVVVFAFARGAGMLTTNEISDVALAQGWGRFWPIARLIPFIALAAAGFVQGSAFLLARIRRQRWAEQDRAQAAKAGGPSKPRTNGARPRSQSTRTRA